MAIEFAISFLIKTMKSAKRIVLAFIMVLGALLFTGTSTAYANEGKQDLVCTGEFANPITGMCWSCVMPIGISSIFYKGGQDGTKDLTGWKQYLCTCDLYVGVPMSTAF